MAFAWIFFYVGPDMVAHTLVSVLVETDMSTHTHSKQVRHQAFTHTLYYGLISKTFIFYH